MSDDFAFWRSRFRNDLLRHCRGRTESDMKHETVTIPDALAFAARCRAQANHLRLSADELDQMAETWEHATRAFGIDTNVVRPEFPGMAIKPHKEDI